MKCSECPALEYDQQRKEYRCGLTGAQVQIGPSGGMPDLGSRRERTVAYLGDDESAFCAGSLDMLVTGMVGRQYVRGILLQVARRGRLEQLLSMYPPKVRAKLEGLLVAEEALA